MTRTIILAAIAALALPLVSIDTAEAGSARQRANARFYEKAKADNADPTGNYAGMPDWARSALAGTGRGRR